MPVAAIEGHAVANRPKIACAALMREYLNGAAVVQARAHRHCVFDVQGGVVIGSDSGSYSPLGPPAGARQGGACGHNRNVAPVSAAIRAAVRPGHA